MSTWVIDWDDPFTISVIIIYLSIIFMFFGVMWKTYKIYKLASISQYKFRQVLTYRMDYWLSTSIWSKAIGLMVFCMLIMMIGGVLHLMLASKTSIPISLWYSWTRMADPGTHAEDPEFGQRIVGVFCTIAGLVALGFLIGIVSDLINQRVDNLRKGRGVVTEDNHVVILSDKWSFAIIPVIQELCNANDSEGGVVIVLLCNGEKEQIETSIASSDVKWQNSRFVVRTGSIVNLVDLKKVSVHLSRSIIVMTDKHSEPDDADAQSLRVVLSLLHMQTKGNIIAEIRNLRNKKLFTLLGKKKIEPVVAHDMIGRIMIQCSRQPGLAQAIDEMLGFDGSEIYSKYWKECIGKTFRECLFCFEKATVIGIKLSDPRVKNQHMESNKFDKFLQDSEMVMSNIAHEVENIVNPLNWFGHNDEVKTKISPDLDVDDGVLSQAELSLSDDPHLSAELHKSLIQENRGIWLNPNDDYVIKEDDEIILFALDVDKYWYHPRKVIPPPENFLLKEEELKPEKFLFVGWRHDLRVMISTLDQYVPDKSTLDILADVSLSERDEQLKDLKVKHLKIQHFYGNTVCQKTLEEFSLETYDTILCLADYSATKDTNKLEARVMASYALLRHILVTRTLNKEALGKMFGHEGKVMTLTETYRNIHLVRKRADLNWFKLQRIRDNIDLPQSLEELNALAKIYHLPLVDIKNSLNRKKTEKINDVDVLVNSLQKRILAFKEDKSAQLISEIMDPQAKDLVLVNDHTQYVASDELSSKALAMVSEWPDINVILAELLSPVGNELYCRSAMHYLTPGENISFDEVISRIRCYNEIPIGYIDDGPDVVVPQVRINPDDKDKKRIWNNRDRIVILGCLVEGNEEDRELLT